MYNIFYYNINKMSDELYSKELDALDLARKKEILKKADLNDRKRSLAGDMLVKKYLSKLYGTPEEKIEIKRGAHGKPYVLNLPAHFNVSHCGDYAVVAISDRPIGIDVEVNEDELKYISGTSATRKKSLMQKSFFEIWTAKEAYLKYLGTGISGGVNSLSFTLNGNSLTHERKDITLTHDYSIPGAVMAIVTDKE